MRLFQKYRKFALITYKKKNGFLLLIDGYD